MGKHTPGPWKWWTSNSFRRLSGPDGKDGAVLCPTVSRSDGNPDLIVSKHDMALIESAPDLLEALEDCLYRIECTISKCEASLLDTETAKKARATIAKAKGES